MLKITLNAARVNANMTQEEAAESLSKMLEESVTRQKVAYYEQHPDDTPIKYANAFSKIYNIPRNNIFFHCESTLSYIIKDKKEVS